MAPPEITESIFLGIEDDDTIAQQHGRRYSQPQVIFNSSSNTKEAGLTVPYTRERSFSASVAQGSALAAQIIATVNNSLNEKTNDLLDETWETTEALLLGSKRLLLFKELPKDRQENPYVLSGYRFYRTSEECFKSLFKLHNETMNIWSHLLGFIFFSCLSVHVFQRKFPEASFIDLFMFAVFCVSSLTCLLCSSIYHTFICHSAKHIKSFTATLDYIGITFLITATISNLVHYGFYCDPTSRNRYILFNCALGFIGIILPFFRFFDTKRYRPLRIFLFVAMAVSSIIPLLHLASVKGVIPTLGFLKLALLGALMYVFGVIIYGQRFPEKFFPGRFDHTGMTSHAIWHVFVCLGIFFHYLAAFDFYNSRKDYGCMHL